MTGGNLLDGKSWPVRLATAAADMFPNCLYARLSEVAEINGKVTSSIQFIILTSIVFQFSNKCCVLIPTKSRFLTLLRSLAVMLSSSRHGIRWTKASIWYFALMNSVLLGLRGKHIVSMFTPRDSLGFQCQWYMMCHSSLDAVLRVGFAFSTHDRRWI